MKYNNLPLVDDIFRFWNPLILLLSLVCDMGDILDDIGEFTDCPYTPMLPSVFIDDTDDADDDGTILVPLNNNNTKKIRFVKSLGEHTEREHSKNFA